MRFKELGITLLTIFLFFACFVATNAQTKRKSKPVKKTKTLITQKQVLIPHTSELQSLLKASIADFANAIRQEDFTVLHTKASKDFQASHSASQVKNTFQFYIDKKDLVLPSLDAVSKTTASFSVIPYIRTEKGYKILVLTGEFPTEPYTINFENEYELENGVWKLLKIRIAM